MCELSGLSPWYNVVSGEKEHYNLNMEDEVVRGSIVLHEGKMMWPAPVRQPSPTAVAQAAASKPAEVVPVEPNYFKVCDL